MRILALCDGGGPLGVGHVMRSLALAEAAVAAGHEVVVAGHFEGPFLAGQLAGAPVEVVQLAAPLADGDLQPLTELVSRVRPAVLHVDSYQAPGRLADLTTSLGRGRQPPRDCGAKAMASDVVLSNVEDGPYGRRPADVVLDPTLGAELSIRPDDGSTWLLRGSRYAPMRRRVVDARRRAIDRDGTAVEIPAEGVARTVLVVMGGTDPVGLAPAAVELLARTALALEVTVIAVGENAERVRAAARGTALSVSVLAPVDDLAAMMSGQDLVISAAGTSVWELCCIGVPMAVVCAVDNQRQGYDRVVKAGAALGLGGPGLQEPALCGHHPGGPDLGEPGLRGPGLGEPGLRGPDLGEPGLRRPGLGEPGLGGYELAVSLLSAALTDSRVRADLAAAGRRVVDGLGAWRVVRLWEQAHRLGPSGALSGLSEQGPPRDRQTSGRLTARRARMDDARLLWGWHNDPGARAGSRNADPVPWPRHLAWLESGLTRKDRVLLVAEDFDGPVGTVRWDRGGQGEWEVSITVAPSRRGQSLARSLLRAGEVALTEAALADVAVTDVAVTDLAVTEATVAEAAVAGVALTGATMVEAAVGEAALPEVAHSSGTEVTAYLAVVHVDNAASVRLFETSAYVPDLPPDPEGFMRFRKTAPVA